MNREALGRLILEASIGAHGEVAKHLAGAWAEAAEAAQTLKEAVARSYPPLSRDEIVALTCMQAGAPPEGRYIDWLSELFAIYDRLRAQGKRPMDPSDMTKAERLAHWASVGLAQSMPASHRAHPAGESQSPAEGDAAPWSKTVESAALLLQRCTGLELQDCENLAGTILGMAANVQPKGLTSVCHIECDGCLDAGKCAFPGKPAEPVRYPHPDEDDAVTLWAEIHRLRAAVQGPDGYATWQEAATAERVRRVAAEKALAAAQAPAPAPEAAAAWAEGYRLGVLDERTSDDNIGIAGFGAKVEPARQNPYGAVQAPAVGDAK